jgi:hypothetical protein
MHKRKKLEPARGFDPRSSGPHPDALPLSYAGMEWSQVRVTIPAVDPYERSLLANEALRDEAWKRV